MIQRIKDWLIKLLGGYTEKDHDEWIAFMEDYSKANRVKRYIDIVPKQQENVVLTVEMEYPLGTNLEERDVQMSLSQGLAELILPHLRIESSRDYRMFCSICRASVTVVKGEKFE